ncbi:MAG: SLBB domain-containing protein [Pontibacterium sp.]
MYPLMRSNLWFSLGLLLIVLSMQIQAANKRVGVLLPEDQQRQRAVVAAPSGDDPPLQEPEAEPLLNRAAVLLPEDLGPSIIEQNTAESLEPVSLEEQIQQQVVQTKLEQFGYSIFNKLPTTFAPVDGIPVPPDYAIGPGDTFTVQIFSAADLQYRLVVTREGRLLVPEVGAVQVAGLTFEEAKLVISEAVANIRIGVKTVVTLSELHSIQVMIVGEVIQPGSYTVSGLSSLLNTLITTGGIKRSGSLRDIQVRRNNKVIAHLDVYELLIKGLTDGNMYLRQGDVIFVPPLGPVVSVAGEVQRPAIYELRDEKTVGDLLQLAGGLLATASPSKTQIERISETGAYTLLQTDLNKDGASMPVKNGDLIRLFPVLNKMENVVLLSGHVLTPGGYQWHSGMRVSDLVTGPKLLRLGAEFDVAVVEREDAQQKRTTVLYFNLGEALRNPGSDADIAFKPRDRLIVFNTHSPRPAQLKDVAQKLREQATATKPAAIYSIKGQARHAGVYPLQAGARVLDLLKQSGGIQPGVDMEYSLLVRTNPQTAFIEFIPLSLAQAKRNPAGDHNMRAMPGDRLYIFGDQTNRSKLIADDIKRLKTQTTYGDLTPVVQVSGKVKNPGPYPLTPGMRVADLVLAAGGMLEDTYGLAATLSRQALLDGEFSRVDQIDVSLRRRNNAQADLQSILEPYDHLVLRQKPEWISQPKLVKVTGEVRYPGTYRVDKRETLCGVIQRVGGFTEDAYLFGTVFLREAVRKREQDAMDRLFGQLDDLLAEVHLSPGYDKDRKMPTNQQTYDTYKVIQQLKPQRAAGRLVVDMASAVGRCDETADLILENGDQIHIPKYADEVSVVGQVYFPSSHQYRDDRAVLDYINLSGGTKELAMREHAYIVQANGEVMTIRSKASTWGWLLSPANVKVTPGSTVYVPLSVDRINGREFAQSWVDLIYKLALSAASVAFLFE